MNILALALTRLSTDFDVPQAATVWIVVTYSAAYLVAMPIVGRLGDLFGRRQAFMAQYIRYADGFGSKRPYRHKCLAVSSHFSPSWK